MPPAPAARGPGPPRGTLVNVVEREYRLEPARVHVARGGLVDLRVRNEGRLPHALLLETSLGKIRTGQIQPGRSAEIRLRLRSGVYRWYSPSDRDRRRGMQGELLVGKKPRG